jgi:hypothetical protein
LLHRLDIPDLPFERNRGRRHRQLSVVEIGVGNWPKEVDAEKGRLNRSWLESFAEDVVALRKRGQDVQCLN